MSKHLFKPNPLDNLINMKSLPNSPFGTPQPMNCDLLKRNGLQTTCRKKKCFNPYCTQGVIPKIERTIERISPTKVRMIIDITLREE